MGNLSNMQPLGVFGRAAILVSVFVVVLVIEKLRPLRKPTQPKFRRVVTNISVAGTSAAILRFSFYPTVLLLARTTENLGWGLIPSLKLSGVPALILSLLLLDYSQYVWHVLLHKNRLLWRFHNIHHIDLDLDASTALRFHFGELIFSVIFRSLQILIFGIGPFTLILFETGVTAFALFHHGNIRLSRWFEDWLAKIIVGPRMHGIHHSTVREQTDSNYGTILTLWDRLHRTLRLGVNDDEITIGVPSYRDPSEQSLPRLLAMPFKKQRPWPT
jgi:sterol desaturase/sphingolipid hydroxylase (fatty acid hydroxylase superfamily)